MAAHALREAGQKFDLKQIHKFAKHMQEIYSLDTLKQFPDKLNQALTDHSSVLKMGREMRDAVYGVQKEDYQTYTESMKKLANSMVDPKGHSKEYKNLVDSVKKAAALNVTTKDLSPEKRRKHSVRQTWTSLRQRRSTRKEKKASAGVKRAEPVSITLWMPLPRSAGLFQARMHAPVNSFPESTKSGTMAIHSPRTILT